VNLLRLDWLFFTWSLFPRRDFPKPCTFLVEDSVTSSLYPSAMLFFFDFFLNPQLFTTNFLSLQKVRIYFLVPCLSPVIGTEGFLRMHPLLPPGHADAPPLCLPLLFPLLIPPFYNLVRSFVFPTPPSCSQVEVAHPYPLLFFS